MLTVLRPVLSCPSVCISYLVFKPLKCVATPSEQLLRISVSFIDAIHFFSLELLKYQSGLQTSLQSSNLPHCSSSSPNFPDHFASNTRSQQLKAEYCRAAAANTRQSSWWQFYKSINKLGDWHCITIYYNLWKERCTDAHFLPLTHSTRPSNFPIPLWTFQ